MTCYPVDSPQKYRRFSSLLDYYLLRWLLMEGGHKIGHSANCMAEHFSQVIYGLVSDMSVSVADFIDSAPGTFVDAFSSSRVR